MARREIQVSNVKRFIVTLRHGTCSFNSCLVMDFFFFFNSLTRRLHTGFGTIGCRENRKERLVTLKDSDEKSKQFQGNNKESQHNFSIRLLRQ